MSATVTTTKLETDAIAYLRVLQPVLTTFTEDETLAVAQKKVDFAVLGADLLAVTEFDQQYGGELATTARWTDFTAAVKHLQALTKPSPTVAFNSYSAVSDLLLDVYERVRDRSGLVRDEEPDVFFLEDAALRALPASVVDAGRYGDSIIAQFTTTGANSQTAVRNVSTYRSLVDQHADEVAEDVTDAVDATASQTMSSTLLGTIDRYRRSVETLQPLVPTQVTKNDIDPSGVPVAQAAEESTAASLADGLYDSIANLVTDRGNAAKTKEGLILASALAAVLLIVIAAYLDIRRLRRRRASPPTDLGSGGHRRGLEDPSHRFPTRERAGVSQ